LRWDDDDFDAATLTVVRSISDAGRVVSRTPRPTRLVESRSTDPPSTGSRFVD
jgi:hypothetical protein